MNHNPTHLMHRSKRCLVACFAVLLALTVSTGSAADARVTDLQARLAEASGPEAADLEAELDDTRKAVRAEVLGTVASEFDGVHSIHRAVEVGSVDEVIAPEVLRPRIIQALEDA